MPTGITTAAVTAGTFTGGVSSTSASSALSKPIELGPGDLSLTELMTWLQTTLDKSDKSIREQMADINQKKDYAAKLGEVIAALQKADNIKKGSDSGRDTSGLPNLTDFADQEWFKKLPQSVQDSYRWVATDTGSDGIADQGAVKTALSNLTDYVSTLNSSNDTAMIRLQSSLSSRNQALQLISNMLASMNDTAKNTLGHIS